MAEPRDLASMPGDVSDLAAYFAARAAISSDAAMQTKIFHERRYHEGSSRTWTLAAAMLAGLAAPMQPEASHDRLRIVGGTDVDTALAE